MSSSFLSNARTGLISSGQSISGSYEVGDDAVVALICDIAMTLSFQGSMNGVDYHTIRTDAGEPYLVTTADGLHTLDLNHFLAPLFIKVLSGTVSDPQAVEVDVPITIITKEI
jgi:hypothetical protein